MGSLAGGRGWGSSNTEELVVDPEEESVEESLESVRQADLGARRLRMSSQHSSGGRTSEAYLAIAPCCISRTQLGWANRTATANWRRACGEEMAHSATSSPTRSPSRRLTARVKWTRWVVSCPTRVCDLGMMKLQQ